MSSVGLDQLFQITASTRVAPESSPRNDTGGDQFRAHLEQASATIQTERTSPNEDSQEVEEDQQVESQTDQEETPTTQQDEVVANDEPAEASGDVAESEQQGDQTADDITLSAAAVAAVTEEVVAQQGQAAEETDQDTANEVDAETSTSGEQQQNPEKPLVDAAKSIEGVTIADSTTTSTTDTSTLVEEGGEVKQDKSSELVESLNSGDESGDETTKRDQQSEELRRSNAVKQSETVAKSNATGSEAQQVVQVKQNEKQIEAEQPVSDGIKASRDKGQQKPEVATVATPLAAKDADILPESHGAAPEVTASTSTTPTGNEASLTADRTIGRVLPSTAADSAGRNVETESSNAPTVDRARFVQRVGGAIRAAQQRDGQIQLRLSPPELGTLKIDIAVNNGVVTAKLETENAAARTVLLDNLPALRERLAEQEIRIEKFDVDVRRDGQQQENPGADERQANQRHDQAANTRQSQLSGQRSEGVGAVVPTGLSTNDSGLDVRI